ncbi:DinB family protein [Isoptericola sp. AK164]|uniref:mycothiol transferase n=1 Tax=Isoptericola sp. AK164 TaxID=3024246 RepID=UPI00241882D0|nr:DinB family protein [Isoptericola sp. AK164]
MHGVAVLQDLYSRIAPTVHRAVDGLGDAALVERLDPAANTIAWLTWHIGRDQDVQVADVVGRDQVYSRGWADRFDLPFGLHDTGYGHTSDDVARVRAPGELLLGYVDAVAAESLDVLAGLTDDDLDEVVDDAWDPPVTRGARLVSVANDSLEHAAQIAYVRGVLERTGRA